MNTPKSLAVNTRVLREAGLRATPQRIALLELVRTSKRPVSAESLCEKGKGVFDLTTAYRTLDALCSARIIRRISLDRARALFEIAGDHHHHAVCTSCGTIRDVSECVSPLLDKKIQASASFARIDSHTLEFFGICKSCAAK